LFAWCVRLGRLLVGFRTHFKSLHFHSFICWTLLDVSTCHEFTRQWASTASPSTWNSLPSSLHDSSLSLNTFQQLLKTHLFGHSRTPPGGTVVAFLCDSGAGYKMSYLLIYLLTYLSADPAHTKGRERRLTRWNISLTVVAPCKPARKSSVSPR